MDMERERELRQRERHRERERERERERNFGTDSRQPFSHCSRVSLLSLKVSLHLRLLKR